MRCTRRRWPALIALGPVLLVGAAHADGLPPVSEIAGTVVSKADGQPLAGVLVVMAHEAKGYVHLDNQGPIAIAPFDRLFGEFPVRNGFFAGTAVTDATGRFVFRNLAAPSEPWLVIAGDTQRGYALQRRIVPREVAPGSLRLELEPAGFIELQVPKDAKQSTVYLQVGLSNGPAAPDANASPEASADDVSEHVTFQGNVLWNETRGKPRRIGPLPAGHWYKVKAQGSASDLPYSPVLAERLVKVESGGSAEATLEPQGGVTLAGQVTSTDDKPLGKVNLTVRTTDGSLFGTVSDANGKFELRGVPPGTHTLQLLRHAKRTAPG